ncbi:Zinc metalloproteinase nas-4 [Orchesella cincta]|uniref:Metalloendopeptidase n=1 Tax=Orchesella cincta TaxID=48709 RepID=A0A1D2MSM3_ORCCI|nr:Zinc metalloproteinase nas-4 [Orchesella cincta]
MSKLKFTLTLLSINSFFLAPALGDGPTCSQMGSGPDDMIMESPGGGGMAMNPKYQWDKRGHVVRVPIVLDHAYSYRERGVIFSGLQEIASKTCVKFAVHKDSHSVHGHDHVYISKTKSKGCWSYVGRVGTGKQDLSLPIGCINHRTVVHEVMHALGFSHEHVRHDRDNYVEILWGNIQQGRERNFQKKHGRADPFGPYDYESIMHYERNAFSKGGHTDTIRPLRGHAPIGKGRHMSHWDVVKINRMYKCGGGGGGGRGGGYNSPFFGFGGSSGHPEGSDTDEDISYDGGPPGAGGRPGESEDDEENDVFSGIDDDPAFAGLFPGSSKGPRGHPKGHPRSRGPPSGASFPRTPYGPPPPPGAGAPSGSDYDDAPKSGPALGPLGAPGSSFPDNPFAKIPLNPFSPRSGLPSGAPDEAPPEYYENPQENKDYFNY